MRKGRNYIWGIIFLVAAFLMLIGKFDFFEDFGMWRVVVGALLVMWLIDGLKRREWGSILFPTAFLCIIFDELPLFDKITPWPVLWAALFGTLGLGMLFLLLFLAVEVLAFLSLLDVSLDLGIVGELLVALLVIEA